MSVYEASITNSKKQLEFYKQLSEQLQVENKQLKQKYEMQKDSNKLLCKAITCDDCNCSVCEAHKENKELKKQLEEYKEQVNKGLYNTCLPYTTGYNKAIKDKEAQQKEFVNYLENMLDDENDIFSVVRVKDILQKYKSIIGVSDDSKAKV